MQLNFGSPPALLLTEGAWRPQQPGRWRFRLELLASGGVFEASDWETNSSRDRLELLAVVRGLEALDAPSSVTLVTASRYVSRGLRFGLSQWREQDWCWEHYGGWTPIRDDDLWRRIDGALEYHHLECRLWSWQTRLDTSQAEIERRRPVGRRWRKRFERWGAGLAARWPRRSQVQWAGQTG